MKRVALVLAVVLSGAGLKAGTPDTAGLKAGTTDMSRQRAGTPDMSRPRAGAPDTAGLKAGTPDTASRKADAANPSFHLTVDSIMRGPDLAGYPPTGLRWSADSQKLYFEWRTPKEKEPSTYVVSREGGDPRKLSADEIKNFPPANGRRDETHRRVIVVDGGDVVMVDGIAGTRRQITRTSGAESNPERHLYTLSTDGGERTKVTSMTGSSQAGISPDQSTLGLVYAYSNKPPEVFVMRNQPGAAARQVTTTPTAECRSFGWIDTNVFFQDSVRLVQRLIELRKENWADEYRRILTLFEDNLRTPRNGKAT
jgi:hypothetical protein